MGRISSWFSQRFSISSKEVKKLIDEPVPSHLNHWWFCLGGTPAYLFLIQIITGLLLAFYYQPTTSKAYESVQYIIKNVPYGWYVRNLHKWSATLMIATVILHQIRVFFTGAYRKPRELNWMIGMCLLFASLMLGFTGYSLVYEQLSYWGVTVGANIAESIPFIGEKMKKILLGGNTYNEYTLSRLFILHAAILPIFMTILLFLHIAIIRLQGISNMHFKEDRKQFFHFFPDHLYTELIIAISMMIILNVLATVFPVPLGPKANPLVTPEVIKPEWFFYTVYRWLKLFSKKTALLSMGCALFLMFIWPFIDASIRKRTRFQEASVFIGIIVAIVIITLTIWEAIVSH